ncbi:hypothetical protein BHM03_00009933, partial [Ensete ventricosum]
IKITAKDSSSLEKSKAIIANLTMVPTVGDIYRSDVIGGGLCHISELSSTWLAKAEDVRTISCVVNVGDRVDVKLIEVS